MGTNGIPLDKAELLSVLLEGLLYGFSLLMFGGTIWVLWFQQSTHQVNRRMLTVACLLLLFSTAVSVSFRFSWIKHRTEIAFFGGTQHLVIDIIRIMEGLILFRDTYPGGPVGYFSNVSQWTFVYKNYVFTAQTLIGDGVILYRCYAVWQSKLVMIIPALLWCAVGVTGIGSPYTASHATQIEVFGGSLSRWITSFYASTLITNLLTTLLLAYRIWSVDRQTARLCDHRTSQLRSILHIVIDAGVIYSVTLLAALLCFANDSNGQYVILDMVTPIISITFYMVIIRVGLTHQTNQPSTLLSVRYASSNNSTSLGMDRRSGMQVHITTLTESKVENGQRTPGRSMTPVDGENSRRNEIKFDDARYVK
ncbi:hypothetical protein J3R83DRAFT_3180 [Lanmaoa asiatica]|nr:hypothetical protein J3R83DRAFT_3180 [Lanmaoa asiatica]